MDVIDFDSLNKEQQIMVVMRKTLTRVIREITPEPGMVHPLTEGAMADVRQCLMLISAREQELLAAKGIENTDRPRYTDEPASSQVVNFSRKKH